MPGNNIRQWVVQTRGGRQETGADERHLYRRREQKCAKRPINPRFGDNDPGNQFHLAHNFLVNVPPEPVVVDHPISPDEFRQNSGVLDAEIHASSTNR